MAERKFSIVIKPAERSDCMLRVWCNPLLAEGLRKIPGVLSVVHHLWCNDDEVWCRGLPLFVEVDLRWDVDEVSDDIMRLAEELEGETK